MVLSCFQDGVNTTKKDKSIEKIQRCTLNGIESINRATRVAAENDKGDDGLGRMENSKFTWSLEKECLT